MMPVLRRCFSLCWAVGFSIPICATAQKQMTVTSEAHYCPCTDQQELAKANVYRFNAPSQGTLLARIERDSFDIRPGDIIVEFEADEKGKVKNIVLVQGVGEPFDAALLATVKAASPFPRHCAGEVLRYTARNDFPLYKRTLRQPGGRLPTIPIEKRAVPPPKRSPKASVR